MGIGPFLTPPGENNDWHSAFLARVAASFARVTGGNLGLDIHAPDLGRKIYSADFALLTHRGDGQATLNYGNGLALRLWECDWEGFTAMPSRATAPGDASTARDELMAKVARDNFVTGYSGKRISARGRLFLIRNVTVWRLLDEAGASFGVGAFFREYEQLPGST